MNDNETLTIVDTLGRNWTIITASCPSGFQWQIYLYRGDVMPGDTLELLHPGGVAHGWTDDDHEPERVRSLLVAMMGLKSSHPRGWLSHEGGLTRFALMQEVDGKTVRDMTDAERNAFVRDVARRFGLPETERVDTWEMGLVHELRSAGFDGRNVNDPGEVS